MKLVLLGVITLLLVSYSAHAFGIPGVVEINDLDVDVKDLNVDLEKIKDLEVDVKNFDLKLGNRD
jgi:hypothetical protein